MLHEAFRVKRHYPHLPSRWEFLPPIAVQEGSSVVVVGLNEAAATVAIANTPRHSTAHTQ